MKRVFFFGMIVYSAAIFLLNDLPAATANTDVAALPWMTKCLVDLCFFLLGVFKMFGNQIHWDEDEAGIHPDDVSVPDTWLYALMGLNLALNFAWHGYQFAHLSGALALYNAVWFFCEFLSVVMTYIFWNHACQIARREATKARARQYEQSESRGRRVSDAV